MTNLLQTLKNYPYDCQLQYLLKEYEIADIVREIIEWLETDIQDNDVGKIDFMTFARDFYIGSDLTDIEKAHFYAELKRQNFLKNISQYLYDENMTISNWTIYTLAKFSHPENAIFLEKAYETHFYPNNPILIAKCLSELDWLGSNKVETYLNQLKAKKDVLSKFTLLMYWEGFSNNIEFDKLIQDEALINFISPNDTNISKDDILFKLFQIEQYFWRLPPKETANMTHQKFLALANAFFDTANKTL